MSDKSEFSLRIRAQSGDYDVQIGVGTFSSISNLKDAVVVADARFEQLLMTRGVSRFVLIEAVETNKNLSTVESIILDLQKFGVRTNSTVFALGGGIIQDLMTMAASIYMRGIEWVYLPTTLLGMVDSCIGGKSSINTRSVKNLIGNIYPPTKVIIDTDFVKTLGQDDVLCGLAEAAKICFCRGENEFHEFLKISDGKSSSEIAVMVTHVLSAKQWFIELDEFDRAERKQLNFGHTFGHALEVGSGHRIPHGLAVATGILAALKFESQSRTLSSTEIELANFAGNLVSRLGDRARAESIDWTKYVEAFKADKKHGPDDYKVLLPNPNGGVRIEKFARSDATLASVIRAQKSVLASAM